MDVAGEMVADLVAYLGIQDLASTCDFPAAMAEFRAVLEKVCLCRYMWRGTSCVEGGAVVGMRRDVWNGNVVMCGDWNVCIVWGWACDDAREM
eukprot:358683-Chlamydomonas_euryale.AAC.2